MGKASRRKHRPPQAPVDLQQLRRIISLARVLTSTGRTDQADKILAELPPAARHAVQVEVARPIHERVTPEQEQQLQQLWARVPEVECRGKCWDSCGQIIMTEPEHALTARAGVEIPDGTYDGSGALCPALTVLNTCGVYPVRPTICRVWGAVENMTCSQGCRPVNGQPYLRIRDGYRLLAEAMRIAGDHESADAILSDFATDELAEAEEARIRDAQRVYDSRVAQHKMHARASGTAIYAHGRGRPSSTPAPGMPQ